MEISKNKVVTMHYKLTDDDGHELDSSIGGEPIIFLQGHGALIPGLESALEGRKKNDKFTVRVDHQNAYGAHDERLRVKVPKTSFEDQDSIVVGAQFQADTDDGPTAVTIVGIEGNHVVIDGNHPLAGIDLNFDVHIVDVREATKDELSHGHAHGPGGHNH